MSNKPFLQVANGELVCGNCGHDVFQLGDRTFKARLKAGVIVEVVNGVEGPYIGRADCEECGTTHLKAHEP